MMSGKNVQICKEACLFEEGKETFLMLESACSWLLKGFNEIMHVEGLADCKTLQTGREATLFLKHRALICAHHALLAKQGWHPCWVTMVLNAITDRKAFCKQCDVLVMGVHRKKPDSSTVLQPCGILLPPCPAPLHSLILPSLAFSLLHQGAFYLILYARFFLLLISFSSSFTLLPPDISLPLYITQVSTKISPPQMIFLDHFCQRCWAVPQSHHAVPLSSPP